MKTTSEKQSLLWRAISKDVQTKCNIFSVSKVLSESQNAARKQAHFYTLSCNPWVNVIALTADNRVLLIEQYRHGIEGVTIEIPGGCIDPDDAHPLAGAIRELREETGCIAERWTSLGMNHPNPALQDNRCYTFLAEDLTQVEVPRFDSTGNEHIVSRYVPLDQIDELIRSGAISHALVITAFHFLAIHRPDLR